MTETTQATQPSPAKGKAALSDTQEIPQGPLADLLDDDYEDEELARRFDARTMRKARRLTGVLALVAALGAGFAGGVIYQKHQGSSSTTGGAPNFSALRAAFGGSSTGGSRSGGAFGGFGGLSGNAVVGTVTAVDNGTLYISEGSSSALVKVVTGASSTVSVQQSSSVSSVQPGDSVVISGAKQKNGSFMASSIRDSGSTATSSGSGSTAAARG
jgi:hypothetical protein